MIDVITRLLYEQRLIKPGVTPKYNFLFTRGTCIVANAIVSPNEAYFIKFSELTDLRGEFALLERASNIYPQFVPRQYGYYSLANMDIIISDRVRYSPVSTHAIAPKGDAITANKVEQFFIATRRQPVKFVSQPSSHRELLTNTYNHLKSLDYIGFLGNWIDNVEVAQLELMPQHCDFVHNNLGKTRENLYVFDWEDYEKVCLPGFDLATFIIADTEFCANTVLQIMNEDASVAASYSAFVKRCCDMLKINYNLFLRLLPVYTAVFLYLKREYGPEIQHLIREFLKQVLAHSTHPGQHSPTK